MRDYCITKLIGLENAFVLSIVEMDTYLEFFKNKTLPSKLSSMWEVDKIHS
jgi:hypothetical protein